MKHQENQLIYYNKRTLKQNLLTFQLLLAIERISGSTVGFWCGNQFIITPWIVFKVCLVYSVLKYVIQNWFAIHHILGDLTVFALLFIDIQVDIIF